MYCIIYGYGFTLDWEDLNFRTIADFVLKHKKTFGHTDEEMQILDALENAKNEEDLEEIMLDIDDTYEDKNSEECGCGAMISTIMTREAGIKFQYFSSDYDCDTCPAILWRTTFPWMLDEKEHNLTEEKLHDICRKYMSELGLDDDPEELEQVYRN